MRYVPLFVQALIEKRDIVAGEDASWPISNDIHGALVIAGPQQGSDDRGREGEVITLLVQRTTRDGTAYTRIQNVLKNFVMAPVEGVDMTLLKGTKKEPLTFEQALAAHGERFGGFLAQRADDAAVVIAAPAEAPTEA